MKITIDIKKVWVVMEEVDGLYGRRWGQFAWRYSNGHLYNSPQNGAQLDDNRAGYSRIVSVKDNK